MLWRVSSRLTANSVCELSEDVRNIRQSLLCSHCCIRNIDFYCHVDPRFSNCHHCHCCSPMLNCLDQAFLFVLVLTAFAYSYSMQALSRLFFAIFYRHRFPLSWGTQRMTIGCNWCLSLFVPIGSLLFEGGLALEREARVSVVSSKVFSAATRCVVIVFCIPLSVAIMVYVIIVHHVRQSARRVLPGTSNIHMHQAGHQAKRELKLMQLLVLQTGSFACGRVIYLINILWQALSPIPRPKPLYSIGFNLVTFFTPFCGINQFLFNKQVKDAAVNYCVDFVSHQHSHCLFIIDLFPSDVRYRPDFHGTMKKGSSMITLIDSV